MLIKDAEFMRFREIVGTMKCCGSIGEIKKDLACGRKCGQRKCYKLPYILI
jgi:hypothetical protein